MEKLYKNQQVSVSITLYWCLNKIIANARIEMTESGEEQI